jgi:ribosomal protein S12 methylthiotransferase accessory factor
MTRSTLRQATAATVNALSRKELLEQFGISRVADLTGLDNVGLPTHTCVRALSEAVSIHAGKGLEHSYSRAGALLEAIEFELAEHPTGPCRIARSIDLPEEDHLPLEDCFPTRSTVLNELTPVAWEEATNIQNGAVTLIPSDLIWLVTRIKNQALMYFQMGSNGIASGGSIEDAILSGLYEILERDAWTLNQYLLDSGFLLTRSPLIAVPPRIETCIRKIEGANLRLHLFDITNDYKVPVFSAIILDLSGRCAGTFGGYGCHLNAEIAAIRAITEAAQARCCYISGARDDLFRRQFLIMKRMDQHKLNDIFNQLSVGAPLSDYRVLDFPDVRTELRYLLKLIRQFGVSEVFVKEMGSCLNGAVHVVRVFSPQCEPFRFDWWQPGLRCLSYAKRKMDALAEKTKSQPAPDLEEEGEAWRNA